MVGGPDAIETSLHGISTDTRFVGSDLRAWHRPWTDDGRARSKSKVRLADDPPKTGPVAFLAKAQLVFAENHAAASKHAVIRVEKTMGVVKAYLQLKAVTATKQMASAHAMLRTRAKVSAGSPPSSHAKTAANKRNTEKKSPNALKKSQ